MNWRRAILTGVLAAGLSLSLVPRANADPPPWAGKWRHHHDKDKDKWDDAHERWHNQHDWDRAHDRWHRYNDRYRYDRDDQWRYRTWNDNDWWRYRNRDGDWRRWHDRQRYDGYRPYYGGYRNYGNDEGYRKLMERMNNDRAKINEIEPTGRHRKALQWYKDDLRNAERDRQNCRR
jgi:hypothetical protein